MSRYSLRSRLVAGAMIWILAGVGAAGVALESLYRSHVSEHFERELMEHLEELALLLSFDSQGRMAIDRSLSDLRFIPELSGYYWQVEVLGGDVLRSESLGGRDLGVGRDPPQLWGVHRDYVEGPTGRMLLLRRRVEARGPQPMYAGIAADIRYLDQVLWTFRQNLAVWLCVVAAGLAGLALTQIRLIMRPLDRMRAAISDLRQGRRDSLPEDLPVEVAPLAADLNTLMETGRGILRRARAQAGNLAHGLKTPLAILVDEGNRLLDAGHAEHGRILLQQCERMRIQIERHLARARAGARSGAIASAPLASTIRTIVDAVSRLHQDRAVSFDIVEANPEQRIACDVEDLYEMLGCVIDNAAKWARSRVRISATGPANGTLRLRIEDDGPGMPLAAREAVFAAGERLDEATPGSGLGLAIVRELVDVYGGKVWIEDAVLGGAAFCLELPAPEM